MKGLSKLTEAVDNAFITQFIKSPHFSDKIQHISKIIQSADPNLPLVSFDEIQATEIPTSSGSGLRKGMTEQELKDWKEEHMPAEKLENLILAAMIASEDPAGKHPSAQDGVIHTALNRMRLNGLTAWEAVVNVQEFGGQGAARPYATSKPPTDIGSLNK